MEAILLLLTFVASALAADNCSITPIFVDFHDRCVDDCFTIQYGLFIGFGTPYQNESLWPSLSHNETTISGAAYCDDSDFPRCTNQTHGLYEPNDSTSFEVITDYDSLDVASATTSDLATIDQVGLDNINIYTHYFDPSPPNVTTLTDFPLTVLTNYTSNSSPWFGPGGLLGLGPSSTLLTLLHDANLISSRSFGIYVGTAYPRAGGAINGSLTLGGYDSGRFTGDAVRYDLSAPAEGAVDESPYRVEVASISLTDFNDGNATTLLSSGAFDAYLTTSQYEMSLPDDITNSFADLTSAEAADEATSAISGPNTTPLTLPAGFSGALTLSLSSGINITIDTTSGMLRNNSNLTPLAASSNDSSSPRIPMLGTSILAHLYLATNYDSTPPSFHLAPADIHGKYVITQPLCPNTVLKAYVSPRISSFERNGIIGAILGGVIGGIGLAFVVFWLWRRWAQKRLGSEWDDQDVFNGEAKGKGKAIDFDDDNDQSSKIPIVDPDVAGVGPGGRRARLKGVLRPSRQKRLQKSQIPSTTYNTTRDGGSPPPKKSWSSSASGTRIGSDDGEADRELYDMASFQGALPPGHHDPRDQQDSRDGTQAGAGAWPLEYPQGHSPPRHPHSDQQTHPRNGYSQSQQNLILERSRSPSPQFSPDEHIPQQYLQPQQYEQQQSQSMSFPSHQHDNPYSNMPLTPNTPLPLLAAQPHQSSSINPAENDRLRPNTHSLTHIRSNSEERRRALGLTVKTEFEAPPTAADRVAKRFKVGAGKGIKEVKMRNGKGGGEQGQGGMLRRMLPGGT